MTEASEEQFFAVKLLEAGGALAGSALIGFREEGMLVRRGATDAVVPFRELKVALAEGSKEKIELAFPGGIAVFRTNDRELIRAILRSPSESVRESLREILEEIRPAPLVFAHGAFLSLMLLGGALLLFQGATALGRRVLLQCPPSWEIELGKAAYEVLGKSSESENQVLQSAVEKVAAPLLDALPEHEYKFQIHVSTSSQVNALAYPGGQIVIYSGLIADTRTPEELAGVIAHELSHVMLRHSLKALGNKLGMSAIVAALPFGLGGSHERLLRFVPDIISLRYSRAQEQEADLGGGLLLIRAGIAPDGMVSFFERMAKEEGGGSEVFGFLASHPLSRERVEYLTEIAKKKPGQTIHFDIDWEAVRKEAGLRPGEDPYQLGRAVL